jgi:hypothetical protein
MSLNHPLLAISLVGALTTGCTGIPYDPRTNNDITPPKISLQVTGQRPDSVYMPTPAVTDTVCYPKKGDFCPNNRVTPVEVGALVPGTANPVVQIHEQGEASVVASASDNESGIKSIKLSCQRTVYYNWDAANQTESNTVIAPPAVIQQNNQVSNGRVPASGIQQQVLNMRGQMVFNNSPHNPVRGHRITIICSAEASNFNGIAVTSQAVVITAQDHALQP